MKRTFLVWFCTLILIFSFLFIGFENSVLSAPIEDSLTTLKFQQDNPIYYKNDIQQDPMETGPVNRWSRLFLLIRYVAQNVPLTEVGFTPKDPSKLLKDGKNGIVTIETNYGGPPRKIEFFIGYPEYKMNGEWFPIEHGVPEVVPFIVNGRTLIPLRKSGDLLNAKEILWNQEQRFATLVFRDLTPQEIKEIKQKITFSDPKPVYNECSSLKPNSLGANTWTQVLIDQCYYESYPGDPVIPAQTREIEIPDGWEVQSIEYKPIVSNRLEGEYDIESGQIPFNRYQKNWDSTDPNMAIYKSQRAYPANLITNTTIQETEGHHELLLSITPIQFTPLLNQLTFHKEIELTIKIKKTSGLPLLKTKALATLLPTGSYQMVIISNQSLIGSLSDAGINNNFSKYAKWKTTIGVSTSTYDIETIQSQYSGADLQEKIQSFIRDAKKTWGIQYVLLGGDTDIVPSRKVYSKVKETNPPTQATFPSDTYYGCLGDNFWKDNNKDGFVEDFYQKMDLTADVYVGRASVENQQQLQNFFLKQRLREIKPTNTNLFLFGGLLNRESKNPCNSSKYTWGECFLENLLSSNPKLDGMKKMKRYQMDKTFDPSNLIQDINQFKPDIVLPEYHGEWSSMGSYPTDCKDPFSLMPSLTIDQLDSLTNANPFLFYTGIPCMTNAFDQINDFSWTQNELEDYNNPETMAEKMIRLPNGGAYAYIGNAHYGWFDPFSLANSASHQFQVAFFNRFLSTGAILGKAFHEAKEQFVPIMAKQTDYRWVYHSLNLLGDPSSGEKTNNNKSFSSKQTSPGSEELIEGESGRLEYEIKNDLDALQSFDFNVQRKTLFIVQKGSNVIDVQPSNFALEPGGKQKILIAIRMPSPCSGGEKVPFSFSIQTDLGEEQKIEFTLRCKKKDQPPPPPPPACCDWLFRTLPEIRIGKWYICPGDSAETQVYEVVNLCPSGSSPLTFTTIWSRDSNIESISPRSFVLQSQERKKLIIRVKMPEGIKSGEGINFPFRIDCKECGLKDFTIIAYAKDCWCEASSIKIKAMKLDIAQGWLEGFDLTTKESYRFYFNPEEAKWKDFKLEYCYEICYETRTDRAGRNSKWGLNYRKVECQ